jgi:type II secretory pathway component PulF
MLNSRIMDINTFVEKYTKTDFLLLVFVLFLILSILFAFVKFFSQWPILLILSFIIAFVIYNRYSKTPDPIYTETQQLYSQWYSHPKVQTLLQNSILMKNDNEYHDS